MYRNLGCGLGLFLRRSGLSGRDADCDHDDQVLGERVVHAVVVCDRYLENGRGQGAGLDLGSGLPWDQA